MLERDEIEILNGSHAWNEAQTLFRTNVTPDPRTRMAQLVRTSWYDTSASEYEGAFCMVQSGGDLESLVGDLLRVSYREREVIVYCVGGAELDTEFALFRRAYFALTDLAIEAIDCIIQPMIRL